MFVRTADEAITGTEKYYYFAEGDTNLPIEEKNS